jgi:hypothetical protein
VRPATAADGPARCELFASIAMPANLELSVRREPDFDALYRLQSDRWASWVVERDGSIEGMGTVLVRDGYLDGAPRRVGYLGDLRLSPRAGGRHLLQRAYAPILRETAAVSGCDLFLAAVIASNTRALRALTGERGSTADWPRHTLLTEFNIRSVHLLIPRPRRASRFRVRRGEQRDVPRIADFLDRDARRRPFGYVFTEPELRRRFQTWPGLAPGSFYLAEDKAGDLVGCVALWDAEPVKRTVVKAYRGAMRRVQLGHDLLARVLGAPRLPAPGQAFRYLYATHLAVPSNDPLVLRTLLEATYADHRGTGYHFISWFVLANDPLGPAFRGFWYTDLPARLYVVSLPGSEPTEACFVPVRPGFEMALV